MRTSQAHASESPAGEFEKAFLADRLVPEERDQRVVRACQTPDRRHEEDRSGLPDHQAK